MRFVYSAMLAGASLMALSNTAHAQADSQEQDALDEQATSDTTSDEEIVVLARRRAENLQDVPLTVNVSTKEDLDKLAIRSFQDIQNITPGLSIAGGANVAAGSATLRGVNFSTFASGANGTVEFYLNDAPVPPQGVLGQMFDIGQIEVLRGPQGTLRGRGSPSGSITVTTQRPHMDEWGGYVNMTGTHIGGINIQGAVNIPIIPDVLAVRIAGLYDENEGDRVTSINSTRDPESSTKAQRVTVRFEPADFISIVGTYLHVNTDNQSFDQVESSTIAQPGALPSPVLITGKDRLAVEDAPAFSHTNRNAFNVQAQISFAGQRLNYTGAWDTQNTNAQANSDIGNFFDLNAGFFPANSTIPALNQGYGQIQDLLQIKQRTQELRLSSEERIAGIFDYIVGAFYWKQIPTTLFRNPTPFVNTVNVLFPPPGGILFTPIVRFSETKEVSFFGNLTAHIGERTEISGGLRHIHYQANAGLIVNGVANPAAAQDDDFKKFIYMASIKHNFSDDLMVYAMTGSSFRPGITVIGDFSLNQSARERSFLLLPPETSKSYEAGVKSSPLPGMRLNATVFYQKFKNYPYRAVNPVFFVSTDNPGPVESVVGFNFVAAVPVTVKGIEVEAAYGTERFDLGINAAWSKGKIKNGLIPCNDYFDANGNFIGNDGIPDTVGNRPTVAQIRTATGGDNLSACAVSQRANVTPLLTVSTQGEYRVPISDATNGFLRGQVSYFGKAQNDPPNPIDDVKAYALINLFLGLRGADGGWEVSLYGKNIFNTYRILNRPTSSLATPFRLNGANQAGTTALNGLTGYRGISSTAPREFGLSARFAFGSR